MNASQNSINPPLDEQKRVTQPDPGSRRNCWSGWAEGLFWGWNVIFLAFMLLGFAPLQLPLMIRSVWEGVTPPIFLVYTLVLIAIPVVATLIAVLFLRKDPYRLFALGYVVEWPLLLILLVRFFVIRQGNPAITVLLSWLGVAEAVFLWVLLDIKIDRRASFWKLLRLAGLTLLFSGTIYSAVWLAFYVPPIAAMIYEGLVNIFRHFNEISRSFSGMHWYDLPLAVTGQLLLFFSGILILMMPVSAPILAGRAWLRSLRGAQKTTSRTASILTALLPLALVLAVLLVSMQQPQKRAFALLQDPPATPRQAQALIKSEEQIRQGLINAYLASYRYLSSAGEVRYIRDLYQMTYHVSDRTAWRIEMAHELMLSPFLYAPVHPVAATASDNRVLLSEQQEAAELYQRFFDRPINQGERQEIVKAVRSTQNASEAELAWQSVDDREVHLNRQEVSVTEHGDWADVQIHEVYGNRTYQRQEVVYYFSLPESAVVTGLWLGSSPDRSEAFVYQVAPRGAAQAVYRSEIRYNRDPALIEQIGPRQYRLRAFPVEPQTWSQNLRGPVPGPALHLWMTYRTMSVDGAWPLPQVAEKFNVYWDRFTTRTVNGKTSPTGEAHWLPAAVSAAAPVAPAPHRVDFPDGNSVLVRPASEVHSAGIPSNLRLAVVLDRSFSMRERAGEVEQALAGLNPISGSGPDPDVYLTSSVYRGEAPGKVGLASLDPKQVFYFGGQNAAELLVQFQELKAGKQYDLILVLTDGTGYELGKGDLDVQVPDAPLWLVHLGGGFPLGYDDSTQQAIQASGGGAASTVQEALARFAAGRDAPGRVDVLDGYIWQTLPTSNIAAQASDFPITTGLENDGFAALAARRVILAEMAKNHGSLDQLPVLDELQRLAVEQSIVTPYSSMIVLVNDEQQRKLEELSGQADRYAREVENIGQTASAPFAVTGVPEPEEWLLLMLAAAGLAYIARRRPAQKAAAV